LNRAAAVITRHPILVLAFILAVTVFFLSRLVDLRTGEIYLELDPALDRLIAEEGPDYELYEEVRRRFGNDDNLIVALLADDIFTEDMLRRVARMTERFQDVDGVRRVTSLSTAPNIRGADGELQLEPFVPEPGEPLGDLAELRRQVIENPIYAGNLVSVDGRATAFVIEVRDMPEREFNRSGIDREIMAIAEEEKGPAEVFLTGPPRIKAETSRTLVSDTQFVVPVAFLITLVVALFSFRNLRGVLVPASTIAISLIWTLGAMTWAGRPLTLVTTILPPLLLSIGFAYAVHVLSAFNDAVRHDKHEAMPDGPVAAALAEVGLPLFLTGLTTAVGFVSLTVSPIGAITEFGVFATLGVVAAIFITMTYTPAVLQLLPIPKNVAAGTEPGKLDRMFEKLALFDVHHRGRLFAATAVVCVVTVYGLSRIEVGNDLVGYFLPGAPVRVHFETINDRLGGANSFHVVLEANQRDAFKEPRNLEIVEELQIWLEERPEVGSVTSLVDYVKVINWGFHDNDPDHLAIPETAAMTDQLLFFGTNEDLEQFVDSRYQMTRILVRARTADSTILRRLNEAIQIRLDAALPEEISGKPTGNIVLVNKAIDDIARGQAESLTVAFVAIYLILSLLFASFRVGFVALIPNAVPVMVYFGAMGLLDIPLNTITGLVACIVLGIAVDDSIHYMTRFSECARAQADETAGTVEALRAVGRPMTYTSIGLCLGFLVLIFTNLQPFIHFGALSAFTLFLAWLIDVTLTPALCSRMRIVNLWDILTLDLGPDFQHTIPLFSGLRRSQARAVALMTSLQTYPKGHVLMSRGDVGDEMYVIIDGELDIWIDRNGKRDHLARLRRGDVVGEVALFTSQRSADVEVGSDARLMRLDRKSLDRLRARFPRIAAVVLDNLAKILATRVTSTTDRLRQ
jgi:uncharacterized protein